MHYDHVRNFFLTLFIVTNLFISNPSFATLTAPERDRIVSPSQKPVSQLAINTSHNLLESSDDPVRETSASGEENTIHSQNDLQGSFIAITVSPAPEIEEKEEGNDYTIIKTEDELEQEIAVLKAEKRRIEESSRAAQKQLQELNEKISQAEQQWKIQKARAEGRFEEFKRIYHQQMAALKQTVQEQANKMTEQKVSLDTVKGELADLQASLKYQRQENQRLHDIVTQREADADALKAENAVLQSLHETLMKSLSEATATLEQERSAQKVRTQALKQELSVLVTIARGKGAAKDKLETLIAELSKLSH
jgi:hypothetical protein